MKITYFIFLSAFIMLNSCQLDECGRSKDKFLDRYYSLIEKVTKEDVYFTEKEWEKNDEKFRAFVEECYDKFEPEMTRREKRRFWAKSLRYQYERHGKDFFGKVEEEAL